MTYSEGDSGVSGQPLMFAATPLNTRNHRLQWLVRALFGLMTLFLVVPVGIIFGVLLVRGGPAISFEFLFSYPSDGMTAGGIWPALVGTMWLVAV